MNEFSMYAQLLALEAAAGQYTRGRELLPEIRKLSAQLSSRLYRVAVIGEFKRGKSSLINAIIGAEVLPTDILPMTAAVTRVTYGNRRRILIRYKDGRTEEKTVEELVDYATKYDEEKARTASQVEEIEVSYPSVFCQNHIDILDTPGLNDNEAMTELTLGVLGEVDAAIVVISAGHPLSITEKQLILDLIAQKQIRHLVFVVTHIDTVSSRKKEQDRVIGFIRQRISGEVLQAALERFAGDPGLTEKAGKILREPDLFGVSSVLAMDGFIQDNWELLEESRFPDFKKELLALLTAAQSTDMEERFRELAEQITQSVESWFEEDRGKLQEKKRSLQDGINRLNRFYTEAEDVLNTRLLALEETLTQKGLTPRALEERITRQLPECFIRGLSGIRESTNTDGSIRLALEQAKEQAGLWMADLSGRVETDIRQRLIAVTGDFEEARLKLGFSGKEFAGELKPWLTREPPKLCWVSQPFPPEGSLVGVDIIVTIQKAIAEAAEDFARELEAYLAAWRVILLGRNKADAANREPIEELFRQLQTAQQELHYITRSHEQVLEKLGRKEECL